MDGKTIAALVALATALGGSATAVIKAVNNNSNTEVLFKNYRVDIALLNAKVGVLMQKTGVVLDIDINELKKALMDPDPGTTSWSPVSAAYAQAVPVPGPVAGISTVIDGCNCICPVIIQNPLPPVTVTPTATSAPAPTTTTPAQDQELFKKILKDQVKKAPKSIDQLSE